MRTRLADGQDVVVGYAPIPDTPWTLLVEEDWSSLVGSGIGAGRYLWILLVLGVIIPTGVVMFGVQRITGPIAAFTQAARQIAGGDFRQSVQLKTGDELEELADQFNAMAENLKVSYETLEARVAQRTQELTALNSIAAVVSRSLDLDQILPDALEKAIKVMNMDGGAVLRLEEDEPFLDLVIAQGLDSDLVALIKRYPITSSVISRVIAERKPVVMLVEDYPPGPLKTALQGSGGVSVVSIPLLAQEKVLGAINMFSRTVFKPDPRIPGGDPGDRAADWRGDGKCPPVCPDPGFCPPDGSRAGSSRPGQRRQN